ncbi:MAG: DUF2288 domain-containing protein [Halieaceae bacterium]|jgi:hypothetical protein|nr:DUF2288 domain-containing protein [Halieaceae bacterium]
MAEPDPERENLLRGEYLSQTARIYWHELQTWYARGSVIKVEASLNLVEVAVQLGLDNTARFQQWIAAGSVAPVTDEQARAWYEANPSLWAVVAAPWVLVQQRPEEPAASA